MMVVLGIGTLIAGTVAFPGGWGCVYSNSASPAARGQVLKAPQSEPGRSRPHGQMYNFQPYPASTQALYLTRAWGEFILALVMIPICGVHFTMHRHLHPSNGGYYGAMPRMEITTRAG